MSDKSRSRSHISGISSEGGILASCIQLKRETKCKVYDPYSSDWIGSLFGNRGSKLAENFVGFSRGKKLILQEESGGFSSFDFQSTFSGSTIRPAQDDEISASPFGACYISRSKTEILVTGGGDQISGNLTRNVTSLTFEDVEIKRNEGKQMNMLRKIPIFNCFSSSVSAGKNFPKLSTARRDHGCGQFLQKGKPYLIVVGGMDESGDHLSSVEILAGQAPVGDTFEFWNWESMGRLTEPRTYFPTVAVLTTGLKNLQAARHFPRIRRSVKILCPRWIDWAVSAWTGNVKF